MTDTGRKETEIEVRSHPPSLRDTSLEGGGYLPPEKSCLLGEKRSRTVRIASFGGTSELLNN